jgi:hypothetical protein
LRLVHRRSKLQSESPNVSVNVPICNQAPRDERLAVDEVSTSEPVTAISDPPAHYRDAFAVILISGCGCIGDGKPAGGGAAAVLIEKPFNEQSASQTFVERLRR